MALPVLNGQQACFKLGNPLFYVPGKNDFYRTMPGSRLTVLLVCLAFPQAVEHDNSANSYKLHVANLPWSASTQYKVTVARVGGAGMYSTAFRPTFQQFTGKGKTLGTYHLMREKGALTDWILDVTINFPANTQDLVTIEKTSY